MRAFPALDWHGVAEALTRAHACAIVCHRDPDPDSVGSAVALGRALGARGLKVHYTCADPPPRAARFLPETESFLRPEEALAQGVSAVVAVDASSLARAGLEGCALAGLTLINIDHHPSNTRFGTINLVEPTSPATGLLIWDMCVALGWEVDAGVAEALFFAVAADTVGFRVRTDARVHAIAAELLRRGAPGGAIMRALFAQRRPQAVRALGEMLARIAFTHEGRVAWLIAEPEILKRTGADHEDIDGAVQWALGVEGVEIAVMLRCVGPHAWKASLRSWGKDVGALAKRLGGGGHRQAAGCTLTGALPEVRKHLETLLSEVLG